MKVPIRVVTVNFKADPATLAALEKLTENAAEVGGFIGRRSVAIRRALFEAAERAARSSGVPDGDYGCIKRGRPMTSTPRPRLVVINFKADQATLAVLKKIGGGVRGRQSIIIRRAIRETAARLGG